MAAANGKKGYTIRFELSLAGLLGVVVVCFCIFLWMFLLGLWAGQTGLISGMSFPAKPIISTVVKAEVPKSKVAEPQEASPEPEPAAVAPPDVAAPVTPAEVAVPPASPEKPPVAPTPVAHAEPSPPVAPVDEPRAKAKMPPYYAVQVGAFRAIKSVRDELRAWRAKGFEAFSRPPAGANEHLTKVYLGHCPDAAAAMKLADGLPKKKKFSPIIVMIKPDEAERP